MMWSWSTGLWLNFRRDPEMQNLHHSDIVTHALTRLAAEYARDKQETLIGLRRRVQDGASRASRTRTQPKDPRRSGLRCARAGAGRRRTLITPSLQDC